MNFTKLKNFMDCMAENKSPGNVVEVYLNGKSVYKYAKGFSSLENQIPLTGEEYFNIYSCSKITTVTAGLQLLEKGMFRMSDPLYEYIPEYKHMMVRTKNGIVEAKNPITIHNLFTMTAGFNYNFNTEGFQKAKELTNGKMNTADVIRCIASDPLDFEPGEHWQYSVGHDVLAGLIEIVSGKKFRDYVKKNIFDPLDMTESVYHCTPDIIEHMAEQYQFVPVGEMSEIDIVEAQKNGKATDGTFKNVGKNHPHILGEEYDSGGSGIITTVSDYAKLMAALANKGVGLTGAKVLSPFTVDMMKTNTLTEQQMKDFNWSALAGCGYGFGVRTHMDRAKSGVISSIGEFGWGGAAGATAIIDTDINLAVFYAQHCLNPREEWYQPRLRNVVYACLED